MLQLGPVTRGPTMLQPSFRSTVFGLILMRHMLRGGAMRTLEWLGFDVCEVHIITSLTEWICPLFFNFLFVNLMSSTSNWQPKSLSLSLSSTTDARPKVVYFEKECNNGYLKKMTEVTESLGRQAGCTTWLRHYLTEDFKDSGDNSFTSIFSWYLFFFFFSNFESSHL